MVKKHPSLTVNQWLASVPAERKDAINAVRATVNQHLPRGYEETVDWGMLAWVVPLATLPDTYNGHPLMLAALGAHKKLNMGGCCVHFKKLDDLPLDVVGNAVGRVTVDQYVERYQSSRAKKNPKTKPKKAKR